MIKKIKWNNHEILGNLELDFTKVNGGVYNTIILAGENGTGKTTILETLSKFLNGKSIIPFEYIEYEAIGRDFHIEPSDVNPAMGFHNRTIVGKTEYKAIATGKGINEDICNNI